MIIKGQSRKDGAQLARYVLQESNQQKAFVLDYRGTVFSDLKRMFSSWESEACAVTKGFKPLYHVQLRLAPGEFLEEGQWFRTLEELEKRLKLSLNPRAVVAHALNGEIHLHAIYSRLTDRGVLLNLGNDHKAHHATARTMEKEFGLREVESSRVIGRNGSQKTRSQECKAAKETGMSREELSNLVKAAWLESKTGREFEAHLAQSGISLARGERRDYVILVAGKPYSPVRLLEYVRAKEFRAKMDLDPPTLAKAEPVTQSPPMPVVQPATLPPLRRVARAMTSSDWSRAVNAVCEQQLRTTQPAQPVSRRSAGMVHTEIVAALDDFQAPSASVGTWQEFRAFRERKGEGPKIDRESLSEEFGLER